MDNYWNVFMSELKMETQLIFFPPKNFKTDDSENIKDWITKIKHKYIKSLTEPLKTWSHCTVNTFWPMQKLNIKWNKSLQVK